MDKEIFPPRCLCGHFEFCDVCRIIPEPNKQDQNPLIVGNINEDARMLWVIFYLKEYGNDIYSKDLTWRMATKKELRDEYKYNKTVKYIAPVFYFTQMHGE